MANIFLDEKDTKRKTQHVYSWIIAHVGLAYYRYCNIISSIISSSRVVLVAAVVLLLSLLLISRSSGDNFQKQLAVFRCVFRVSVFIFEGSSLQSSENGQHSAA